MNADAFLSMEKDEQEAYLNEPKEDHIEQIAAPAVNYVAMNQHGHPPSWRIGISWNYSGEEETVTAFCYTKTDAEIVAAALNASREIERDIRQRAIEEEAKAEAAS